MATKTTQGLPIKLVLGLEFENTPILATEFDVVAVNELRKSYVITFPVPAEKETNDLFMDACRMCAMCGDPWVGFFEFGNERKKDAVRAYVITQVTVQDRHVLRVFCDAEPPLFELPVIADEYKHGGAFHALRVANLYPDVNDESVNKLLTAFMEYTEHMQTLKAEQEKEKGKSVDEIADGVEQTKSGELNREGSW